MKACIKYAINLLCASFITGLDLKRYLFIKMIRTWMYCCLLTLPNFTLFHVKIATC